jgi:hypothetical protein
MSKEVIIMIDQMGNIEGEAAGFVGSSCTNATKFLEKLGVVETELKPEYFQKEQGLEQLKGW